MEAQIQPITGHLTPELGWDDDRLLNAARAVRDLIETPAWDELVASIEGYERLLHLHLLNSKPTDVAADHERRIGKMAGVLQLVPLAEGIVVAGEARATELAQQANRQAEEAA